MNRELAQMVLMTASRARVALGELIPLLKQFGDAGDNDDSAKSAIAAAIDEIGLVEDSVFSQYPDIKLEFEARLTKYGRSFF